MTQHMVEQYIYTRADGSASAKGFGHGITQATAGIAGELANEVASISRYGCTVADGSGNPVKVLEKRALRGSGCGVLQQSVRLLPLPASLPEGDERRLYYSSTFRAQFLSHGYVIDPDDVTGILTDPDCWFGQTFAEHNVNLRPAELEQLPDLPRDGEPLMPLGQVLEQTGLSAEHFITAVRSCFDTETRDTITLIEMDFTRPDAASLSSQLLRWIFHFLPFSLRRMANITSCYDAGCGGKNYSIGMISSAVLEMTRGGQLTFRGMPNGVRYGYLFGKGICTHQKLSSQNDFDTGGSLCAVWLEQVIRLALTLDGAEQIRLLEQLDQIYQRHDKLLLQQPPEIQCSSDCFDALTWAYLTGEDYSEIHIIPADDAAASLAQNPDRFVETLLSLPDSSAACQLLPMLLDAACLELREGWSGKWIQLLERLSNLGIRNEETEDVSEICFARLLKQAADDPAAAQMLSVWVRQHPKPGYKTMQRLFFRGTPLPGPRWAMAAVALEPEDRRLYLAQWLDKMIRRRGSFKDYLTDSSRLIEALKEQPEEDCIYVFASRLLPMPDQECRFELNDFGAYHSFYQILQTTMDSRIQEFYNMAVYRRMKDACSDMLRAWMEQRPEELLHCLREINRAFEWAEQPEERQTLCSVQEFTIKEWILSPGRALPDCPETLQQMTDAILQAARCGAAPELLWEACCAAADWLLSDACSHRTVQWYAQLPEICRSIAESMKAEPSETMKTLALVSELLNCAVLSFDVLAKVFEEKECSEQRQQIALKELTELYRRGELDQLQPDVLVYAGLQTGGEANQDGISRAFTLILNGADGVNALCRLLNCYPGAEKLDPATAEEKRPGGLMRLLRRSPEEQEEVSEPRQGLYCWMETDEVLMDALEDALRRSQPAIEAQMERDNYLGPALIETIWSMAGADTVWGRRAEEINSMLSGWWEKLNPSDQTAKKKMRALRKSGAFQRGG